MNLVILYTLNAQSDSFSTTDFKLCLVPLDFDQWWPMSWAKWRPSQVGHSQIWRSSFDGDQLEMVINQHEWEETNII